ncbi:hypothetical protein AcW1_005918 [Taiwanofungus camphoratus]|nr:hypothetical protein AcW2_004670 [Antrodia cinnamomea]KAI0934376.1 hypothetical protein AcV5_006234 [Antrodia cinnamomea]KAI0950341.1 hypothetical protein AcV7_008838 [Antrodia cinnamomea]KAI0957571.1 hypothetical protein AcW1_005918 [Antrodia cinnamomea]
MYFRAFTLDLLPLRVRSATGRLSRIRLHSRWSKHSNARCTPNNSLSGSWGLSIAPASVDKRSPVSGPSLHVRLGKAQRQRYRCELASSPVHMRREGVSHPGQLRLPDHCPTHECPDTAQLPAAAALLQMVAEEGAEERH